MNYKILIVLAVLSFSFAFTSASNLKETVNSELKVSAGSYSDPVAPENPDFKEEVENLYDLFASNSENLPSLKVFEKALKGYSKLEEEGKVSKEILTVVDFDLSSKKERMWIMDMNSHKILFNNHVAHGKNTGVEFADDFSNTVNSLQSSLGFYVTGETYYGKNGLSLFIDGMENGFNTNARKRYVVIHGADYAEPSFVDKIGRLGRSYGCPAVPNTIALDVIELIKEESVVFIHKNDENYLKNSSYLN